MLQHFCYLFIIAAVFLALYIGLRAKEEYKTYLVAQNNVRLDFFYLYVFGAVVGTLASAYGLAYAFFPDMSILVGPIGILMRSTVVLFVWLLWKRPYNLGYVPVILTSAITTGLMFSIPVIGIGIYGENFISRPWVMVPATMSALLVGYLYYQFSKKKQNGITKILIISVLFNFLSSLFMGFSDAKFDFFHLISLICFALVFVPLFIKFIVIKK